MPDQHLANPLRTRFALPGTTVPLSDVTTGIPLQRINYDLPTQSNTTTREDGHGHPGHH